MLLSVLSPEAWWCTWTYITHFMLISEFSLSLFPPPHTHTHTVHTPCCILCFAFSNISLLASASPEWYLTNILSWDPLWTANIHFSILFLIQNMCIWCAHVYQMVKCLLIQNFCFLPFYSMCCQHLVTFVYSHFFCCDYPSSINSLPSLIYEKCWGL